MGHELTLAIERALGMWARTLSYAKPVDEDLIEIWELVMCGQSVTPDEMAQVCRIVLTESKEFPTPAAAIEVLEKVRDRATRVQLGNLVKARMNGAYNCLTTPDRCEDGQLVEGGGNGRPLDELEQTRELVAMIQTPGRLLTTRQRLALPLPKVEEES